MLYASVLAGEVLVLFIFVRKLHIGFGRLFYKLTKSEKTAAYLMSVLFFPGTFVHEMSHFFVALFLLVPVGSVDLFPRVDEHTVRLGSVQVAQTDFIRRALVGFAPVFFGLTIIISLLSFVATSLLTTPLAYALVAYVVFEIANTMFLSRRDLAGSWKILVFILIITTLAYFLGIRVNIEIFTQLFTPEVTAILHKMSIFVGIPVIIDFVFIVLFRFIKLI